MQDGIQKNDLTQVQNFIDQATPPEAINYENKAGETTLMWAVKAESLELLKKLLGNVNDITNQIPIPNGPFKYQTAYDIAEGLGNEHIARLLAKAEVKRNPKALHDALSWGQFKKAGHMIDEGIPLAALNYQDPADDFDATPLRIAPRCGQIDLVKQLLALGKKKGITLDNKALFYAWDRRRQDVIKILLQNGVKDQNGTVLTSAARNGNQDILEAAVQANHSLDIQDQSWRKSPFLYATEQGIQEIVGYLLQNEADSTLQDKDGKEALDYAKEKGNKNLERLIQHYTSQSRVRSKI